MLIKQFIDISQEIEVEVHLEDFFEHLHSLPQEAELFWLLDAVNAAHGILKRIPDDVIATMNSDRRQLIYNALQEQLKRYETGSAESGEWKPATPFG